MSVEKPDEAVTLNVRAIEIEPADWIGPGIVNSVTVPLDDDLPVEVRFTDGTAQDYRPDDMVQVCRVPLPKFPYAYTGERS